MVIGPIWVFRTKHFSQTVMNRLFGRGRQVGQHRSLDQWDNNAIGIDEAASSNASLGTIRIDLWGQRFCCIAEFDLGVDSQDSHQLGCLGAGPFDPTNDGVHESFGKGAELAVPSTSHSVGGQTWRTTSCCVKSVDDLAIGGPTRLSGDHGSKIIDRERAEPFGRDTFGQCIVKNAKHRCTGPGSPAGPQRDTAELINQILKCFFAAPLQIIDDEDIAALGQGGLDGRLVRRS